MLYRLSYEASTGAGLSNLGSESRLMYKCENQLPTWVNDWNKWIQGKNQLSDQNNAEFVKTEVHYPTNLQIATKDACTLQKQDAGSGFCVQFESFGKFSFVHCA